MWKQPRETGKCKNENMNRFKNGKYEVSRRKGLHEYLAKKGLHE